jgi:glycosyltransferase involved in cell wall biosynthesis
MPPRDTRVLRVAVLCDAFIRYGSAQARALRESGADVTFYYIDRLGEFAGNWDDREEYLQSVKVADIPIVRLPQRNMRRFLRQTLQLHRDLRRRQIDVLVVQQHIDPRYATLAFRFRTALIVHDPQTHSGDYASTYPLAVRAVARVAEATASLRVLHSARLLPQMRSLLRDIPIAVVPHGAEVSAMPEELRSSPSVVLAGRLMEYKGINVALEAFSTVVERRPETVLVLAGRGRLGAEIRKTSPPGVLFRDEYLSERDMREIIGEARLVILPYLDATQSGVGIGAIARGIPCIVSDTGGLPDLVPPGHPWIVAPGDAVGLADAILGALDHSVNTRVAVVRFAAEHFGWPHVGELLMNELNRLVVE